MLFVPDCTRETFVEGTHHGGHDGDGRSLRYLEWTHDPDPSDSSYVVDFAVLLRDRDGSTRVVHDRHVHGLFDREQWLGWLTETGFDADAVELKVDAHVAQYVGFVGRRVDELASRA